MKRIIIFLIMAVLSAAGRGAMTRDQVCIEQNGWHQANPEYAQRYGYNVWTPYGDKSDEWICWQNVLRPGISLARYTIAGTPAEGDTFTLTIGAVSITSAAADATPTVAESAAALAAAWEASEDALVEPIYAYAIAGTGVMYLRGVPGEDFTVTESKSSVAGTITEAVLQTAGVMPETYSMYTAFKAKVKAGHYMALNKSIVNASAGPIWYPTPASGTWGAGVDVTNSAAWSLTALSQSFYFNGFAMMFTATATRTLSLKVPSGTTRLYLLGAPMPSTGARTCAVAALAGDEAKFTVADATVDFSPTGDLVAYGENIFPPNFEIASYDGYPNYQSVALIATNFTADATVVITPTTAATNVCYIAGFIAIKDATAAQPDTGVFDPTTIEYLMPSSYDNAGTQTPYEQYAEGPIYFNLDGGTATFWGNGHWAGDSSTNALNTLSSPSCVVTYNAADDVDAVFASISGTAFTTPAENAWVRYVTDAVTLTTTGTIDVHDGTNNKPGLGTYRLVHQYTSSGMAIMQKWLFDDDADAVGTVLTLEVSAGNGGYVAQWSLDNEFKKYLRFPYDTTAQTISAFGEVDADEWTTNVTSVAMFDSSYSVTALFSCGFSYYDASATSGLSKPLMHLMKRIIGDGFYKIYMNPVEDTPDTDIPIAENDEIYSWQMRSFLPSTTISDIAGAVGVGGKSTTLNPSGGTTLNP